MATSATCVTGLTVVDVSTQFNLPGQLILLALIQIGGIGFMSMSMLIALIMGQKIGLKSRILVRESLNYLSLSGVINLVHKVIFLTFAIEGVGAFLLTLAALRYFPWPKALYFGIFYSISSFCNAGIDALGLFDMFLHDGFINVIVAVLIILGGLGFMVLIELLRYREKRHFSLHSRMVLIVSSQLIIWGTILLLIFESGNPATLGPLCWPEKILTALFHSITSRTAGYSTLAIGSMTEVSMFIMLCLMFIGASPGSPGGGIKTTTFGIMILAVMATIKGEDDINFHHRRISREISRRAFAIAAMVLGMIIVATLVLCLVEQSSNYDFVHILFEVVSASGTVGLSAGITSGLGPLGKCIIIFLMFVGRLGSFTVALALAARRHKSTYHYPEERIIVG